MTTDRLAATCGQCGTRDVHTDAYWEARKSRGDHYPPTISPREAVRQLHVLYGIAMTNKLTQDELVMKDVYGEIVRGLHQALLGVTNCNDVPTELAWLVDEWEQMARMCDVRQGALFGSWAGNIRNLR